MQVQTRLPQVGTTIFSVMSALAVQHRALNLGQGFPDFDPPAELIEAMAQAARDGKNQYAPMPGILPLRQAIADKVQREYGATVDPDTDITVMAGASQAIFNTVLGLVHPGDEVIVLDPCYDCYDPAITLAGARAVHVPLDPKTFAVDWDRVRAAVTPKTRMLFVNSPHNPTGALFDERDIDELTRTVHQTGIIVLSDEVYEHIVFDGRQHLSVLRHPELAARSVVISSFGKTYHCTGWKIGYAVAPKVLS
ncbi:MAG: aminotransferase class I/II-fold pyridoxal phosphate-dependent enzyme, partial [Myxococcota bacterium]